MSVELEFIGHACFRLWEDGTTRALTFDTAFSAAPAVGNWYEMVRFSTEPITIPLEFFGLDTTADPGLDLTASWNPIATGVSLSQGATTLSNQVHLFDTGAQISTLSYAQTELLGFDLDNPEFVIAVQGAAGIAMSVPGFTLARMDIPTDDGGFLTFFEVPFFTLDIVEGIDGILGMNLFNSAASMVYDPFDPIDGPSLDVSFFLTRLDVVEDLDSEQVEELQLAFPAFAGALGLNGVQLPAFEVAGDAVSSSISNFVWHDLDGDGIQGLDEPGVEGVEVDLYDAGPDELPDTGDDTFIESTVTNAVGLYAFDGLDPGNYYLDFHALPFGYGFTAQDAGGDDTLDSDPSPVTGLTAVFALGFYQHDETRDAGLVLGHGAITGLKWHDLNGDGVRDEGEPGLAGVRVYLDLNANGTWEHPDEPSVLTDADGQYEFDDVAAGPAVVREVPPEGSTPSYPLAAFDNGGFENGNLSYWTWIGDASIETAAFGVGPTEGTYQALLSTGPGAVGSADLHAFLGVGDLNTLGNDPAIEGSALRRALLVEAGDTLSFDYNFLTNEVDEPTALDFAFISITPGLELTELADTDDANTASATIFELETGFATFSHTFAQGGLYILGIGVVDGDDASIDSALLIDNVLFSGIAGAAAHVIIVDPEQVSDDVDFGNELVPGEIHGLKWNDLNGDGERNEGEPGLEGWTIELDLGADGSVDLTTQTLADGSYSFTEVGPGTHRVREAEQAGWSQTSDEPDDVTITAGEVIDGIDFGNFELVTLSGVKFHDHDGDGIRDEGEEGLAGWTIELDLDADGSVDVTTVTGADGSYSFTDVGPGTHRMREVEQAGWTQTTANPEDVTVGSGQDIAGLDFGNFELVSISGVKFEDENGNAVKDADETGLAGWTIVLIDPSADSVIDSTTAADGSYSFDEVGPGTYRVREVAETGWALTTPNPTDLTVSSGVDVDGIVFGNVQTVSHDGMQDAGAWTMEGDVAFIEVDGNAVAQMNEGSDAAISQIIELSTDASQLMFKYSFVAAGDGDRLIATINGVEVFPGVLVPAVVDPEDPFVSTGPIDISAYAGLDVLLEIRLVSAGEVNAQVQIDDVVITAGDMETLLFGGKVKAQYIDANGNTVTVALSGLGDGVVTKPFGNANAVLIETNNTTNRSKLTIASKGGKTAVVDIVVNGPIGTIAAKSTDLLDDLTSGPAKLIQLADVADQHVITIGPSADPRAAVTFLFANVQDLSINSAIPIKALTVYEWLDSDPDVNPDIITAPRLDKLTTKGDRSDPAVDGDFQAGLLLSGAGTAKYTLRSAKILGDLGSDDPANPAVWDITGNLGSIDASRGNINGWDLQLHSSAKSIKLGVVEQANVTIGDEDAAGHRGDLGSISASQWNQGTLIAGALKSLSTKANSKLAGAFGDFGATLLLTGSSNPFVKGALGNAKIGRHLTSDTWTISGDVGSIDASKGTIDGWSLQVNSNVKKLKLGLVTDASIDVDGGILSIAVSEWLAGNLHADYIKSLKSSGDKKAGTAGDFRAAITLDGSALPQVKATLVSAKISGDLGSGDALSPIAWDITGDVIAIDASKGTVEGWTLDLHSNIKSLKLGLVEQADLTIAGDVGTISASQWNQGDILADSIKSLTTKPNRKLPGADGDFNADIQLAGSADAKVKATLGSAKIAGRIFGAFWEILSGDIGAITAGVIDTTTIRAGIDPALAPESLPNSGGADFTSQSRIASVTVKGIKGLPAGTPTYLNSILAAWELGKLKLNVVKTDNAGFDFGLAADFIDSVVAEKPDGSKFPKLSDLDSPADIPAGFDFEDFKLILVEP